MTRERHGRSKKAHAVLFPCAFFLRGLPRPCSIVVLPWVGAGWRRCLAALPLTRGDVPQNLSSVCFLFFFYFGLILSSSKLRVSLVCVVYAFCAL